MPGSVGQPGAVGAPPRQRFEQRPVPVERLARPAAEVGEPGWPIPVGDELPDHGVRAKVAR
ncbi:MULTISPECIES: hypothetical protein [Streptomyces]|uniref:hypothetical protein n=1 Tax=Streptomyces TaxID=1883 RepID=UPI0004CC1DFF|nr:MULTISPECIES: hypothetical protein [Streptomyces]MDX2918865.1 hypothetical protein [Streptomyces sp. NE06-03C]MDX3607627.1 hypothetical protein [Streptomyces sp. FL06-04B]MDX3736775.1 hypothetical protein [Streptomyces sp. ID01-15D]